MRELIFNVYINNEFYKTFRNKEIKDFFIDWNEKLAIGQTIKTKEGNLKVITASVGNPQKNNGNQVTDIKLQRI